MTIIKLVAAVDSNLNFELGQNVSFGIHSKDAHYFHSESGERMKRGGCIVSKIKQHGIQSTHQKSLLKRMWEHKVLYLMILPCLLFFLIFNYIPMTSLILAFKDFRFDTGIIGGDWKGLHYFKDSSLIQDVYKSL